MVEEREDGLTYYKATDSLVAGTVIRKFETGRTAERNHYENGKRIGDWFAYGYSGEDFMHGYSVELDTAILNNNKDLILINSTLSFTTEYPYKYAALFIPDISSSPTQLDLIKLNNENSAVYKNNYEFENIHIYYKRFQYRF